MHIKALKPLKSLNLSPLQKEADCAVVVAVTSRAVFDCGADDGDEVCEVGVAFPLLQVDSNTELLKTVSLVSEIMFSPLK